MENIKDQNILKLSLPIFVSSILSMAVGYVDTAMLSGYNENSVGAIGNANTVLSFITLAFTIVSSATGILTSQYSGARKRESLNQVYTVSLLINLILSVIVSLILFIFHRQFLNLLNVPVEMQGDAASYIQIVGGFIFTQSIFSTFDQIFRCNGKTKIGMVLALCMNLINIGGNYCVLFGPLKYLGLGASGVAYSTALSRIVVLILSAFYFKFRIDGKISIQYLRPFPLKILKQLLSLGIPTAGENISYNLSQIAIAAIINTMGIVAINTRIYCSMLCTVAYVFSYSLSLGTQIVVGHNVGAKDYDTAYKKVLNILKISLVIALSLAVLNCIFSRFTLTLFSDNSDVIALGQTIMLISVFLEIGRTTNIVIIGSMKASGDVKFPTIMGICSMWGISVLFAFVLGISLNMGLIGVWIAMAGDEIFRGIVVFIRWMRGSWRGKTVVL
ncbi:MAG TPA: MATE family efflux transporter [Candidatus Fimimorpha faecalis]|uniref:MATE family efflux transporter n=1 Tax=Candidatus Fimimorpha faecalis TaxID=2840824 RepID=A0A9D1EED6_9FIRM|nr:MATE family efflux transporter [Candidatus Fimimorpha faecalis]